MLSGFPNSMAPLPHVFLFNGFNLLVYREKYSLFLLFTSKQRKYPLKRAISRAFISVSADNLILQRITHHFFSVLFQKLMAQRKSVKKYIKCRKIREKQRRVQKLWQLLHPFYLLSLISISRAIRGLCR